MNLPNDAADYLYVLAILAPVLSAWVTSKWSKRVTAEVRGSRDEVREVRDQVVNDHSTNMRNDLDKIHEVQEEIKALAFDIQSRQGSLEGHYHEIDRKVEAYRRATESAFDKLAGSIARSGNP